MTTTRIDMLRLVAAPFLVLAVLFGIPSHSAVGGADLAGTANGGGTILFERQNHWYTIAPDGTQLHMLLSSTAGCPDFGCAVFSPDGSQIMAAAQGADKKRITIATVKTDGSGYHALPLPDARLNLGPGAWTPDGNRVALGGWDDTNKARAGIYAVNASDGQGLFRLTTSPDGRNDDPVAYSPDGSRLLFFHEGAPGSQEPGFGGLFETTATGSGRVKVNPPRTQVTGSFGSPASWSPDGKQITFTAFSTPTSGGRSAVFVEDANGTHRRRITPWGEWSTSAHWSPDGTWSLFDKARPVAGEPHRLYLVHPNGTGLRAITSTSLGGVCCAVWSPDGKKLLLGGLLIMNRNGSRLFHLTPGDTKHETAEYAWGP
jgi:Tol biopolymer transport system component